MPLIMDFRIDHQLTSVTMKVIIQPSSKVVWSFKPLVKHDPSIEISKEEVKQNFVQYVRMHPKYSCEYVRSGVTSLLLMPGPRY